jgi:hypothetical protein
MIWIIIIAAITVLFGVLYLKGKCDGFIAGYNTSSPEEQRKYDIKRLRLIVACFHFVLAALMFLFLLKNTDLGSDIFFSCLVVASVAAVVLANTWAKKKKREHENI